MSWYPSSHACWQRRMGFDGFEVVQFGVDVTSLTGTSPTLNVTAEQSIVREDTQPDDTKTEAIPTSKIEEGAYPSQWTSPAVKFFTIKNVLTWMRLVFTLGGTVTDCDLDLYTIARG